MRLFQQLLCDMGTLISVDGKIGPQTQKAGERLAQAAPDHPNDAYAIVRRTIIFLLAMRDQVYATLRAKMGAKKGAA